MSIRPFFVLFPPYLNATAADGRRSEGPIVLALQFFLRALSTLTSIHIPSLLVVEMSGVYDDPTVTAVMGLQRALNTLGANLDPDGNFGPMTRAAICRCWKPADELVCSNTSWWADPEGNLNKWPPESGVTTAASPSDQAEHVRAAQVRRGGLPPFDDTGLVG